MSQKVCSDFTFSDINTYFTKNHSDGYFLFMAANMCLCLQYVIQSVSIRTTHLCNHLCNIRIFFFGRAANCKFYLNLCNLRLLHPLTHTAVHILHFESVDGNLLFTVSSQKAVHCRFTFALIFAAVCFDLHI